MDKNLRPAQKHGFYIKTHIPRIRKTHQLNKHFFLPSASRFDLDGFMQIMHTIFLSAKQFPRDRNTALVLIFVRIIFQWVET